MIPVRILHRHEPPYGWWYTSPDLPGLVGGAATYAASKTRAEDGARFYLECAADEEGTPAPNLDALELEHFVPASEAPTPTTRAPATTSA